MNDLDEITAHIDMLLAQYRPDRYEPDGGDEWLDEIADLIGPEIPAAEARSRVARMMVRRREGDKTKATNRFLREINDERVLPIDWMESMGHLPLVVGKERVAVRAATVDDFRQFAQEERRRAATDFTARNATCEGAEWLADQMESGQVAA